LDMKENAAGLSLNKVPQTDAALHKRLGQAHGRGQGAGGKAPGACEVTGARFHPRGFLLSPRRDAARRRHWRQPLAADGLDYAFGPQRHAGNLRRHEPRDAKDGALLVRIGSMALDRRKDVLCPVLLSRDGRDRGDVSPTLYELSPLRTRTDSFPRPAGTSLLCLPSLLALWGWPRKRRPRRRLLIGSGPPGGVTPCGSSVVIGWCSKVWLWCCLFLRLAFRGHCSKLPPGQSVSRSGGLEPHPS
jgi:hypothetical protein